MRKFPGLLPVQAAASQVAQRAVHIPLDVFDVCTFKYLLELGIDAVADFPAADIEHVLLPCLSRLPAGDLNCPVGMLTVELAVGGNHFRFEPYSELEPQLVHFIDKAG